jgi:hypothetical protein
MVSWLVIPLRPKWRETSCHLRSLHKRIYRSEGRMSALGVVADLEQSKLNPLDQASSSLSAVDTAGIGVSSISIGLSPGTFGRTAWSSAAIASPG